MRHSAKKSVTEASRCEDGITKNITNKHISLNNIWTLLEQARREENMSSDTVFIRECSIHPDQFLILENDRKLQFCTSFAQVPTSSVSLALIQLSMYLKRTLVSL